MNERDKKQICPKCKRLSERSITAPNLAGFDNYGRS